MSPLRRVAEVFQRGFIFLEMRTFFRKENFLRGEGGSFASKGVRLLHRDFKGGSSEPLEPPPPTRLPLVVTQ